MLLLLTIAAVIGAFIALDQRDKAESRRQQALSQSLAGQAAEVGTRRPDLGILLAVEAWRHAHTSQAEQALINGAEARGSASARDLPRQAGDRRSGTSRSTRRSSCSATTVRSSAGARARLRLACDRPSTIPGSRRSCNSVRGHSVCRAVARCTSSTTRCARSPDNGRSPRAPRWSAMGGDENGSVLVVGDQGGQLRLWSVADHTPIGPAVVAHPGGVNAVAMRSDGRRVVSLGAADNQLKTWSVTPTGLQPLATFTLGASGAIGRVPRGWSHDRGRRVERRGAGARRGDAHAPSRLRLERNPATARGAGHAGHPDR